MGIKVTFTVQDVTEYFWVGFGEGIEGVDNMPERERFYYLMKLSKEGTLKVKSKRETGQFRDAVELNSMLKTNCNFEYKKEPRRGYKLLTFIVSKA